MVEVIFTAVLNVTSLKSVTKATIIRLSLQMIAQLHGYVDIVWVFCIIFLAYVSLGESLIRPQLPFMLSYAHHVRPVLDLCLLLHSSFK